MLATEFATGKLTLYTLGTRKEYKGGMPTEKLTEKGWTWYGLQTASYSRIYEAMGADTQIDLVIRIPADFAAKRGEYVILEDGEQYRIDIVRPIVVGSYVRATELTLIRLEDRYDIDTV